jgi:hypothetical protein
MTDNRRTIYQPLFAEISDVFKGLGYPKNLLKEDYSFSDFLSEKPGIKRTDLAVFGQEPFDYRSACFSFNILEEGISVSDFANRYRSLGSPFIFVIKNGHTENWINKRDGVSFSEEIATTEIPNYLKSKRDFRRDVILREKVNLSSSIQMDAFVDSGLLPALEIEVGKRIDFLITRILNKIKNNGKDISPSDFKFIFELLTAKLFDDKEYKQNYKISIDKYNINDIIKNRKKGYENELNKDDIDNIVSEIKSSISFKNLSVDSLTYIYENTLVTQESRKKYGFHSTPSYVADYLVNELIPADIHFDKFPSVYDPMCGHGILLVAAMRKMKTLLPLEWNSKKRHNFFVENIFGNDIDDFSIEIAKMCLTLADFPESNGWNLQIADIFREIDILKNNIQKTDIVIANPPFEDVKVNNKEIPKPTLLLSKIFENTKKGAKIGIILPSSFLDRVHYKNERKEFLTNFNIISITNLPENIFQFAKVPTIMITAQKEEPKVNHFIQYSFVNKHDTIKFKNSFNISWSEKVNKDYFTEGDLIVPLYKEIWDYLNNNRRLKEVVTIKKGVEYYSSKINPKKDFKDTRFENSLPAITGAEEFQHFYQYHINKIKYIPNDEESKKWKSWENDWTKMKIVVPSARTSGGLWKYAAAIDLKGRYVTRNFYVIWPNNNDIKYLFFIAAVLNSPIANAFVFSFTSDKTITKRIYELIPIPSHNTNDIELIYTLVNEYLKNTQNDKDKAKNILLKIDAEILKLYNLPPKLENKLLKIFWKEKRKVPFKFDGYYPPYFNSWIPLYVYISQKYNNSNFEYIENNFPRFTKKITFKF